LPSGTRLVKCRYSGDN